MITAILPLRYVERGDQIIDVVQSALLVVSGVDHSIDTLPPGIPVLAAFSPATYVVGRVWRSLIDGGPGTRLGRHLTPLVVLGLILVPAGLSAFALAEEYAKRSGAPKRVDWGRWPPTSSIEPTS